MTRANRTCFFITPIGEEKSSERFRSDRLCSALINPVLKEFNIELIRGDQIHEQGNVLVQVIKEILDAKLIIVDLTGLNSNVLYELGVADAFSKPVFRIISNPAQLPFNLRSDRITKVESKEFGPMLSEDLDDARIRIDNFLKKVLNWDHKVTSSVTEAVQQLPVGLGEGGFSRMVGGFQLADGWSGIEKALRVSGANIELFRSKRPKEIIPGQCRVVLTGALGHDTATIYLSFGDWMENEVEVYLKDLSELLVECRSPYGIVADHVGQRRWIIEAGEVLDSDTKRLKLRNK